MSSSRALPTLCRLLLLALLLTAPTPARAQTPDAAPPTLGITRIDTGQFPVIRVYVYGENLGAPLADIPMQIQESGSVRETMQSSEAVGFQVALVFDASSNVRLPGITGAPRVQEVKDAIAGLAAANLFDDERDWLTFISLGSNTVPRVVGPALDDPWEDYDYQAVWNSVVLYEPPPNASTTPLNDLVRFSIQQFGDPALPSAQQRHIVVFSDGTDLVSVLESEQVVGLAREQQIRIHTVQLGNDGAAARRTLQQLAQLTGGVSVSLDGPNALVPIRQTILDTAEQAVLTFQSQRADPGELRVTAALPGNKSIETSVRAPAVNVQPVSVRILQPPDGAILERSGDAWDAPLDALAPAILPVQLGFEWPDGRPRILTRVEVEIGGKTTVLTQPPFDQLIELPVSLLGTGEYTVRARALDEVGLSGASEPVRIQVTELRPPAPTPTPIPTATPTETPTPDATATRGAVVAAQATATAEAQMRGTISDLGGANQELAEQLKQLSWITIASAALALLALGFAVYVLSSRDRRKRATEIVTGTLRSVTEPFMRSGRKSSGASGGRAQLVLVDSGGTPTLPASISLQGGSIRIGRDPSVSNVILDDRRISRFHCQIREEMGGFRILDEGSTSGTYVNDAEVGIHGQALQPGDLVGIGPAAYRFETIAGSGTPGALTPANGASDDSTVPLIPRTKH